MATMGVQTQSFIAFLEDEPFGQGVVRQPSPHRPGAVRWSDGGSELMVFGRKRCAALGFG